ncbi:MAG: class II aldolase/adducin family protein [Clostridiales bacterium]|nr:class II aldolase/adducin family protein [Clostridiales bacterium]
MFLTDGEARKLILEIGRRMYLKNFVAANDGNISCKVEGDAIWVTPSGVSKGFMEEATLVKMRLDGSILSRGPLEPSSETKMHLRIYRENPRIMGVTHAHPPVCTSFAVAGLSLDKEIYAEALVNLGKVPCLPYETPGSQAAADAVALYCRDYSALLLGNHGAVTWGKSLLEAFFRLEALEHYAAILLNTSYIIGKTNSLDPRQQRELQAIREKLS